MAYGQGWDPSAPDGAITPAADIDVEFQNLKTALGERLVQVMPEWADDLADPKKLSIVVGTLAARPGAPDFAGEMYFATDNSTLYIADTTPAWVSTGGVAPPEDGTDPASATHFFWAPKAGDQVIPASSGWTALSAWAAGLAYGSWYTGGAPTRFTAPVGGTYDICANICFESSTVLGAIRINGSGFSAQAKGESSGGLVSSMSLAGIWTLSAGDYIEIVVDNLSFIGSSNVLGTYTHVKIVRLP